MRALLKLPRLANKLSKKLPCGKITKISIYYKTKFAINIIVKINFYYSKKSFFSTKIIYLTNN